MTVLPTLLLCLLSQLCMVDAVEEATFHSAKSDIAHGVSCAMAATEQFLDANVEDGCPDSFTLAGYGIITNPTFSVSRVAFILAYGGVYAIAGIRCTPCSALHS